MDKKALRREYLRIRAGLSSYTRSKADRAIVRTVETLEEFRNAALVTGYVTDGTEPDVLPLIRTALKRGCRACLPKWDGSQYLLSLVDEKDLATLAPGKWGLMEPVSTRPADAYIQTENVLYLVPGVPLINGLIDITDGHIQIGISRFVNAFMLIICIAIGMSVTLMLVKDSLL